MKRVLRFLLLLAFAAGGSFAQAASLSVQLAPDAENPATPAMGDILQFRSVITAEADAPVEGLVAWISLVEMDPGREQSVDLEDWSAHKAVTVARLEPGETLESTWPIRLIQDGSFRVVVSVTARNQGLVDTSRSVEFRVRRKPVVESRRIFPVAIGVPLALLGLLGYRRWQAGRVLQGGS